MSSNPGRPKPLVQVWRSGPQRWEYDCDRCCKQGWDRTWPAAYERARAHAAKHSGVGFTAKG